jgi:hypothetical protein
MTQIILIFTDLIGVIQHNPTQVPGSGMHR